jgi:CHAD domain-containing protein
MPRFDKWLGDVGPDAPVSRAARRAVTLRLAAVEHFFRRAVRKPKPGGASAEAVHQLRIWTRRAAAALRLFSDFLPKKNSRWLKRKLRKVRRAGGDARDCDVMLARLPTRSNRALASLVHEIQSRRRIAERELARLYKRLVERKRLRRHRHKLLKKIKSPKKLAPTDDQFGPWCRRQLEEMGRDYFKLAAANLDRDARLHELRIAGKRLRYALELAAVAVRPDVRETLYEQLSDLQDRLGAVCDSLASTARLQAWLKEIDDPEIRKQLRGALARERTELARHKAEFRRWWTARRRAALARLWKRALGRG